MKSTAYLSEYMCYFVGWMCYLGALKVARSWQGNRCTTHHPTHHFGTRQMTMATQDIDLAMNNKNDGRFQKRVEKMPPSAPGGVTAGEVDLADDALPRGAGP